MKVPTHWGKREAVISAWAILLALVATSSWGSVGPASREGDRQPPKEAFEACAGLTEGASAELKGPNGEAITGTCKSFGGGTTLALVPDRPPQDGAGTPPGEPPAKEMDTAGEPPQ
ncbi:hypothetical protein GMSM_08450 [Geomonas sp. Red276]